jgi:hypothetical protein
MYRYLHVNQRNWIVCKSAAGTDKSNIIFMQGHMEIISSCTSAYWDRSKTCYASVRPSCKHFLEFHWSAVRKGAHRLAPIFRTEIIFHQLSRIMGSCLFRVRKKRLHIWLTTSAPSSSRLSRQCGILDIAQSYWPLQPANMNICNDTLDAGSAPHNISLPSHTSICDKKPQKNTFIRASRGIQNHDPSFGMA